MRQTTTYLRNCKRENQLLEIKLDERKPTLPSNPQNNQISIEFKATKALP